ncbi:hypothetical protein Pmani_010464 [Petrolisthes manimaculis]|uniref:Uncharacterized protein n=1 Tax=Petrolisthes manimaculis TaxID=1843537 RepID=A0AAE1Q339_9EUCA|nr:hypothetical protein Pmani_010464 [Petrolisthes manimaculis]
MDPDTLKVLLDSQNQSFRSAVDIIVDQFKSRITDMETRMSDLTRSLEFTQAEVTELKSEVKELRKSDSVKQTTINELQTHVNDIEQRTNYQEDYSRRNNLRISGMEELPSGETWEQTTKTVQTILEDKLQLPPTNLERAHRIGPGGHSQPRTIVVRFEKFGDREAVLRNARKLKGTGIFINEDLCAASQEIIRNKLPQLKQARSEGKIAFFKHTKLIIKEQTSRHFAATDTTTSGVRPTHGWRAAASEPGSVNTTRATTRASAGVGAGDTVRPAAGMTGGSDGSASMGRGEEAASTVETGTKLKKDRKKK